MLNIVDTLGEVRELEQSHVRMKHNRLVVEWRAQMELQEDCPGLGPSGLKYVPTPPQMAA
jgi:hypothetical protein